MSLRSWIRHAWTQLPFFGWLVLLWMMLWGQFTWLALITGIAVAIVVTTVFRLPAAELTGRINPWWMIVDLGWFVIELVSGALQVAWQTVQPHPPSAAIVRAPLRVDDDLIMTHVSVALSLVPGTTVLEADRTNRVLYLHAIGPTTPDQIEDVRRSALEWEARIVRAVGSRAELALVREKVRPFVERSAS
ncbi:Na+/H+ antiporter subunit E [Microbacterium sp. G2-8]|uniref:Na+/H+ antiporter subunit E n=1 Tax=Microbacterium sp. G2-8 TaxID=2842454 RepID=UPI001C8A4D69|nr:Na+/H+ antiporter subunit E [Microbacterium sp. G2-8]